MLKNTLCTLTYTAWNATSGTRCTGDVSNHTCRISKDGGTFAAAANTPTELENGVYALTLTSSETNCAALTLSVTSNASGVVIPPVQVSFDDVTQYKADVSSIASDAAADVWSAASRTLTGAVQVASGTVDVSSTSVSAIQNGLAASSALAAVSGKIDTLDSVCDAMSSVCSAAQTTVGSISTTVGSLSTTCGAISDACSTIQVRTNLIPDLPAAVGSAMTLTNEYSGLLTLNANSIAAGVLAYDISNVESSAPIFSLCTEILAHLQSSISGSTWTIYRTNGVTQHASRTIAASDESTPVTGVSGT